MYIYECTHIEIYTHTSNLLNGLYITDFIIFQKKKMVGMLVNVHFCLCCNMQFEILK